MFTFNAAEIKTLFWSSHWPLLGFEILMIVIYFSVWFLARKKVGSLLAHQFFLAYLFLSLWRGLLYAHNSWQHLAFTVLNGQRFSIGLQLSLGLILWTLILSKEKNWSSSVYDIHWGGKKYGSILLALWFYATLAYAIFYLLAWNLSISSGPLGYLWPWWQAVVWSMQVLLIPRWIKGAYLFSRKRRQEALYTALLTAVMTWPLLLWDIILVRIMQVIF